MEIGNWVRRDRSGAKWHLVESTIASRAVTKCGREMPLWGNHKNSRLEISEVEPLTRVIEQPQLCKRCK